MILFIVSFILHSCMIILYTSVVIPDWGQHSKQISKKQFSQILSATFSNAKFFLLSGDALSMPWHIAKISRISKVVLMHFFAKNEFQKTFWIPEMKRIQDLKLHTKLMLSFPNPKDIKIVFNSDPLVNIIFDFLLILR